MLSDFLALHRADIIELARAKVATRSAPRATPVELKTGIPLFLDQLIGTLRVEETTSARPSDRQIGRGAARHGKALQALGFTVAQVVHDYGEVCQAITKLAVDLDAPISADEFRTLNRCLDEAMAEAVSEFGRQRELSRSDDETERLGFFAHELRNLLSNSMLAFEVLKSGSVGVSGSTGAVVSRNFMRMRDLIDRSLVEVRLKAGIKKREPVQLAHFIEELEVSAMIEAKARGLQLTVTPVEKGVTVEVDRQVLASAVSNLLQNAFKFTRPKGHVLIRTHADADRVFIAIEDECGSAVRIAAAWALAWRSPVGASAPMVARSPCAASPAGAASSPSSCHGCTRTTPIRWASRSWGQAPATAPRAEPLQPRREAQGLEPPFHAPGNAPASKPSLKMPRTWTVTSELLQALLASMVSTSADPGSPEQPLPPLAKEPGVAETTSSETVTPEPAGRVTAVEAEQVSVPAAMAQPTVPAAPSWGAAATLP
jgi:signal transduction histidine kinase